MGTYLGATKHHSLSHGITQWYLPLKSGTGKRVPL